MKTGFYLSYLLVFISSCFFCGHLNAASTGTFTVKFGQTTEDTFRATHPEAINIGFNNNLKGNIYKEMPNDNRNVNKEINFENLKNVFILFDQNKNLIALYLYFESDDFSILSKILAKKYTTTVKKTSFIGSDYMELYNEGVSIYLMTPFIFSNTSLFYIRTDIKYKILKNTPKNILKDEGKTLSYLMEKSFPLMK